MRQLLGIDMDGRSVSITLTIVGAFLTIVLTINAFFIKEMLESLNQVQVQTAVLLDRSDVTKQDISDLKKRVLRLEGK